MRRMMTTKQSDYVNSLSEVAEKGFKVGTYPAQIDIVNEGELDWEWIESQIEEDENIINFESHEFNGYLGFYLPRLFEQYGLGEDGEVGYISYAVDDTIIMPNSVVDFESLKVWMQSQDFIDALDETGYSFDDTILYNDVAMYKGDDPADNIILVNSELKLNTYIECTQGEGEEIVGASDPISEPVLQVKNAEIENLQVKNGWLSLCGYFADDDNFTCAISIYPTIEEPYNLYHGIISYLEPNAERAQEIWVNFTDQKVYSNDTQSEDAEITLGSANIKLINMVTGEVIKSLEL